MHTTAPDAGQGRLRVSQIVYVCDLTGDFGRVIPLGVIADIRVGPVYGLGLKARKQISDLEASWVGALARDLVRRPFDMLLGEFDAIWEDSDPEESFCAAPDRHPGSLSFGAYTEKSPRLPELLLIRAQKSPEILRQWAEDKLTGGCDTGFWRLLEDHFPEDDTTAERRLKERLVA